MTSFMDMAPVALPAQFFWGAKSLTLGEQL